MVASMRNAFVLIVFVAGLACSKQGTNSSNVAGQGSSGEAQGGAENAGGNEAGGGSNVAPIPSPRDEITPPASDAGFTRFTPSADAKVYYVSADGSDDADGLSPRSALKTPAAALTHLRDGFGDWVLFRRGDTFGEELGQLTRSGRSGTDPIVFGSYGEATQRPVLAGGFSTSGAGSAPPSTDYVAVVSLEFYHAAGNPDDPAFDPSSIDAHVLWLRGTKGLLIEDCVFRFGAVSFQDFDGVPAENVVLRRTQILDNYSVVADKHAQGLFTGGTVNLKVEECLLDHNGWHADIPGAETTIFNHNIYLQNGTRGSSITDSIIMRGSSHGMQCRGGATVEGNFMFRNPINILIGGGNNPDPGGVVGMVRNNVILEAADMPTGQARGWGIELDNIQEATVAGNLNVDCKGTDCRGITFDIPNVVYSDNLEELTGSVDGTLEEYARSIGLASLDEFYAELRKQSKFRWREDLTASAINAWFRQRITE